MALVRVTGNAWDHSRDSIPTTRQPELYFKPNRANITPLGLATQSDVKATLNPTSGVFWVDVDNAKGITYTPWMRWLSDPAGAPGQWTGYAEWETISPGQGGSIGALKPNPGLEGILIGMGAPDPTLRDSIYLDLSGAKPVLWAPKGVS